LGCLLPKKMGLSRTFSSPPVFPFERPQTVGDTGNVLGDLELRGASMSKTSGTFWGFVDAAVVNSNCTMVDVTIAPPYTWRP